MTRWTALRLRRSLLAGLVALSSAATARDEPAKTGRGWSMVRLDLDVSVLSSEERLRVAGEVRLRLDALPESYGPTLFVNTRLTEDGEPVMRFERVVAPGARVEMAGELLEGRTHGAHVRLAEPVSAGSEIVVEFDCASRGVASQIVVHEAAALASWVAGWHPFTDPSAGGELRFLSQLLHVPGQTTLHLPPSWVGMMDGELRERRQNADGTTEVWETPGNLARSLVAGPYVTSTERVNGRDLRIYMLPGDKPLGPERLALLLADGLRAIEERLGPYPFSSYGVAEFPAQVPAQTWYAASQQTFITAKSTAFEPEHGNLPLWAHEMSHGWWGNAIGTRGPGSKWVGESLAQLGAVIAIEALEGREAMREFLHFSRSGYSPRQCAAGYYFLVRQGEDEPLSTMERGGATHDLADSKGVWVYHMLRRKIGDDAFFGVLRGVVRDFVAKEVSVEEMRQRFVEAVPEHDLETFFSQWLDRDGAPVLELDWHAMTDGSGLELTVTQLQTSDPFELELELGIELVDGGTVTETVEISKVSHVFTLLTAARPIDVELDPDGHLLLWRPAYGPRPDEEIATGRPVPDEILKAVLGSYRFKGLERDVEVFLRDGVPYVRPEGAAASRMFYRGGGLFEVDSPGEPMLQEFDLSTSPAPSFVSREGAREYVAERVGR